MYGTWRGPFFNSKKSIPLNPPAPPPDHSAMRAQSAKSRGTVRSGPFNGRASPSHHSGAARGPVAHLGRVLSQAPGRRASFSHFVV